MDPAIDTTEIGGEIGARIREELDYAREAKHAALYRAMLAKTPEVRVPRAWPELSTRRLLTLDWLEGDRLLLHKEDELPARNRLAIAMFKAWWQPFSRYGVIHGDPHLGNYTAFIEDGSPQGINLLDYGCIRIFPPKFVGGVVDLYQRPAPRQPRPRGPCLRDLGFQAPLPGARRILNIWARFIYGPLLDDRERTIADGVKPSQYGRREAFTVHRALKEKGPVRVPREFVFMDRAAIGLGGVFLHLAAKLNYHRLFNEAIESFSIDEVAARQRAALVAAGLGAAPNNGRSQTCGTPFQIALGRNCAKPQPVPCSMLERLMADHGELEYATAEGNDVPAHEASYEEFIQFVVIGTVLVITIVVGLAIGGVIGNWLLAGRGHHRRRRRGRHRRMDGIALARRRRAGAVAPRASAHRLR